MMSGQMIHAVILRLSFDRVMCMHHRPLLVRTPRVTSAPRHAQSVEIVYLRVMRLDLDAKISCNVWTMSFYRFEYEYVLPYLQQVLLCNTGFFSLHRALPLIHCFAWMQSDGKKLKLSDGPSDSLSQKDLIKFVSAIVASRMELAGDPGHLQSLCDRLLILDEVVDLEEEDDGEDGGADGNLFVGLFPLVLRERIHSFLLSCVASWPQEEVSAQVCSHVYKYTQACMHARARALSPCTRSQILMI